MNVTIPKALAEAFKEPFLESVGLTLETFRYSKTLTSLSLDISKLHETKLKRLITLAETHRKIRGAYTLLEDIKIWSKITETPTGVVPRNVTAFSAALLAYMREAPKHRLYSKTDVTGVWEAYYCGEVKYHPPVRPRGGEGRLIPDYVSMDLYYYHFGSRKMTHVTFHKEELGGDVVEILRKAGYVIESAELFTAYEEMVKKFTDNVDKIGKQFHAVGEGTEINDDDEHNNSWWRYRSDILVGTHEIPGRVVIDVFQEGTRSRKEKEAALDTSFWSPPAAGTDEEYVGAVVDDDLEEEETPYSVAKIDPVVEVPLHGYLVIFDMAKHRRILLHISQLTEYIYDEKLGEKLILPRQTRALVEILLEHKGKFKDIIAGKGAGAVVLCAGPPGTGKTLTAEVYSEVSKRPLYTVQCSQLGLTPSDLEEELLKVFSRAQRWNAILLLDEADVYVRSRGNDLNQNAIVGVFLRVLEYYNGVLFLTTNRPELVDDAIASRCIARIVFEVPPEEDQKKIWKVLSQVMDIPLTDVQIDELVNANPRLSGRDIKNLLKLAALIAAAGETAITVATIEFVKRFKPTGDIEEVKHGK